MVFNSNFTTVYGVYIYISNYLLWFINQRSHHWGAAPCKPTGLLKVCHTNWHIRTCNDGKLGHETRQKIQIRRINHILSYIHLISCCPLVFSCDFYIHIDVFIPSVVSLLSFFWGVVQFTISKKIGGDSLFGYHKKGQYFSNIQSTKRRKQEHLHENPRLT